MKAMILSGGRGKRLRPVTDTIPKPLIKINGKPLIEWKVNYLKTRKFSSVLEIGCFPRPTNHNS